MSALAEASNPLMEAIMNAESLANQTREQALQQQRLEADEVLCSALADADVRLRTIQRVESCLRVELAELSAVKPKLEQLEQQVRFSKEDWNNVFALEALNFANLVLITFTPFTPLM